MQIDNFWRAVDAQIKKAVDNGKTIYDGVYTVNGKDVSISSYPADCSYQSNTINYKGYNYIRTYGDAGFPRRNW